MREGRDLSSADAFASNLDVPFEELELAKLIGGGGFGQVTRKAAAVQHNADDCGTAWYSTVGAKQASCGTIYKPNMWGPCEEHEA